MKTQRHYSTVPEILNYGEPLSSSKNLEEYQFRIPGKEKCFCKSDPCHQQSCQRRHAVCGSLETQSKEQQHHVVTALPSPWLATVQVEKTVNLKEWNEKTIFNFITYPKKKKKKRKRISNSYTTAMTTKKRERIYSFPLKNYLILPYHPIYMA